MQKSFLITVLFFSSLILFSCRTSKVDTAEKTITAEPEIPLTKEITLVFAGDVMAHKPNYIMQDYSKIWTSIKEDISGPDLAFANIESPVDATKEPSSYPNFNMPVNYIEAAINAGFDVFSLANNHSFDQFTNGIFETIKTTKNLEEKYNSQIYFSGLRQNKTDSYSYNLIQKNDWTILFLPITQILNYPHDFNNINYVRNREKEKLEFIEFCKNLRQENPCDLFILSVHADEPEYVRTIPEKQRQFYIALTEAGVDIVWANHAHLIKDREIIHKEDESASDKIIMYANGNTISAQRTKPDFSAEKPNGERDNTGDGILFTVTLSKQMEGEAVKIKDYNTSFITTYINPNWEFVVEKLDKESVENNNYSSTWKNYLNKRIIINETETKELEIWQ